MDAYEWGVKYGSCEEALKQRKNYDSQADWYRACNRGDWLVWQFETLSKDTIADVLPALNRAVDIIIERSIHRGIWSLRYNTQEAASVWCLWADKWLIGEDRSYRAAKDASDSARTASRMNDMRVAMLVASDAAYAADVSDAAVLDTAWSVRKAVIDTVWDAVWAELSVTSIPNERVVSIANAACDVELEQQAKDIRREIPEWPGGN